MHKSAFLLRNWLFVEEGFLVISDVDFEGESEIGIESIDFKSSSETEWFGVESISVLLYNACEVLRAWNNFSKQPEIESSICLNFEGRNELIISGILTVKISSIIFNQEF